MDKPYTQRELDDIYLWGGNYSPARVKATVKALDAVRAQLNDAQGSLAQAIEAMRAAVNGFRSPMEYYAIMKISQLLEEIDP